MILDGSIAALARRVLRRPWQVFACGRCHKKVDSSTIPGWGGPGDLPPGWELRVGFHDGKILCEGCLRPIAEEPKDEERRVYAARSYATLEGDRGLAQGIKLTCSRCEHVVECFGITERSERRAAIMLREGCPREERNFYTTDPEGAETELAEDLDEDDEEEGVDQEEHALPRVKAILDAAPRERLGELLDALDRAIPAVVERLGAVRESLGLDTCGCCEAHLEPGGSCPKGCDDPRTGQCTPGCGYCERHCRCDVPF